VSGRLTVTTGTRAGEARDLGPGRISLGRDALCDIRFDPTLDSDVSARHAELREERGAVIIRDANSTNGTYVNGERVRGERQLQDGDVIQLGAKGPKLRYDATVTASNRDAGSTVERVAVAVQQQTRGLRLTLAAAAVVIVSLSAAALWTSRSAAASSARELARLRARNDSLSAALDHDVQSMAGRVAGLDSALAQAKRESERLREQLRMAVGTDGVKLLSARVAEAENRRGAIMAASRVDYSAIARANERAVAMIAVEMPDGTLFSGTGFSVTTDGLLVTNRHLVQNDAGDAPKRIAVVFADTRDWLPAHVEKVAADADLAILRLDGTGPFPVVRGLATAAPATGVPVALIGFPLGTKAPMDGGPDGMVARPTLGVGTISKTTHDVIQVDAFAIDGSSGTPVFGSDGNVVGVVYGGAAESGGRIVYAVPAQSVSLLLR
jgi:S1-C subfamily serine protease